jgi:hypothetical protein
VLQRVVVPSQVIEVPGTLVQEVTGMQLRVATEHVVVHIDAACAEVVTVTEPASAMIARSPTRIRAFLMDSSFKKDSTFRVYHNFIHSMRICR